MNVSHEAMKHLPFLILFVALAYGVFPVNAYSQVEEQCPHLNPMLPRRNRIDSSPGVRKQLVKLCIKEIKEDYERILDHSEEIARLSTEIQTSFNDAQSFSNDDQEKLARVQNLVKKVRKELRISDDDEEKERPESLADAVNELQATSTCLLEEIKKAGRHSISLVAVQSSNAVMYVVRFLRQQ